MWQWHWLRRPVSNWRGIIWANDSAAETGKTSDQWEEGPGAERVAEAGKNKCPKMGLAWQVESRAKAVVVGGGALHKGEKIATPDSDSSASFLAI